MDHRPVVWILQQDPRKNFLPAARFGELKYLFPHSYQIQYSDQVEAEYGRWIEFYDQFEPEDFLLLAGDPMTIAVASIYAHNKVGNGRLKFLKWDRETSQYVELSPSLRTDLMASSIQAMNEEIGDAQ